MQLKNKYLTIEFDTKAAEIASIKDQNGEEFMYDGKSEYWGGRNPILFPQVGNTFKKYYYAKGQKYAMGNNGFARHKIFDVVKHTDDTLVLLLKDDEDTYSQYPYHFELYVTYHLVNNRLEISYKVKNLDEETMPFGFGQHPAFKCPVSNDEKFEDYKIVFEKDENQTGDAAKFIKNKEIHLNFDYFNEVPTLIYENLNSDYVQLVSKKHVVEVGCKNYRYLAFWTKEGAPFICIEPWMSHGDFADNDLPFGERESMIKLGSNEEFNISYYIEIK